MSDNSTLAEVIFNCSIGGSFVTSLLYLLKTNNIDGISTSRTIFLWYLIIIALLVVIYYILYKVGNLNNNSNFNWAFLGIGVGLLVIILASFFIGMKTNWEAIKAGKIS